ISLARHLHSFSFSFNPPAPPELYTLSLHDALPISTLEHDEPLGFAGARIERLAFGRRHQAIVVAGDEQHRPGRDPVDDTLSFNRSEEHTSELQSRENLVCRLLLEKKKKTTLKHTLT